MSQKALSMRKIKEVLRLRYDLGLLQNEIARSCSIGQGRAAGLPWPLGFLRKACTMPSVDSTSNAVRK